MIPSVDSQPLSLVMPVIAQWWHERSDKGGRDGNYEWARQYGLPLIEADQDTAAAECQAYQQQRPILSTQHNTIPWGDHPVTWCQVDYNGPLPLRRRQCFILTEIDCGTHLRLRKCGSGLMSRQSTDVTIAPTIPKQLAWLSGRMAFYTSIVERPKLKDRVTTEFSASQVWLSCCYYFKDDLINSEINSEKFFYPLVMFLQKTERNQLWFQVCGILLWQT